MAKRFSKIVDFLKLERIEDNIFRGESKDLGTPQVYGGQVLGQAIQAAQQTVEGRVIHSVHAYFLRRGDFNAPIIYEVERTRDGRSFSARRVVAIQHGRPIFTMSASFQIEESGFDYGLSIEMPPTPSKSLSELEQSHSLAKHNMQILHSDFDLCRIRGKEKTENLSLQWWIKTHDPLPDESNTHLSVLAYISDFGLLSSALLPHGLNVDEPDMYSKNILFSSIDHAIWFHRPARLDEWLLYNCHSLSTSNGRGTAQGSLYSQDGVLIASTVQEGLVRKIDPI